MRTTRKWFCLAVTLLLALAGCSKLQNDINVPLPSYSSELVVECYLEPGKVPNWSYTP